MQFKTNDIPPAFARMCGLNPDLDYSKNIWHSSIEEQSTFADAVCRMNVSNLPFLKIQYESAVLDKSEMSGINNTGIGNYAFLALNSPDEYKGKYKKLLDALLDNDKIFANYQKYLEEEKQEKQQCIIL